MTVLVIAEHDNVTLKASTLNTVAAATRCGDAVEVMVLGGAGAAQAAAQAARLAGVAAVSLVEDASLAWLKRLRRKWWRVRKRVA